MGLERQTDEDRSGRRAFLRVINYKHGRHGPDLAAGWRFAVAAGLLGQDVPSVRIRVETARDTASVVATLSGVAQAKSLTLLTAADPTGDYRKAQWRSTDIAPLPSVNAPTAIAELDVPEDGVLAVYARIVAEGDYCDSVNCSNIVEIGEPAIVPRPR